MTHVYLIVFNCKEPFCTAMWQEIRFALQCKEEKPCKRNHRPMASSAVVGYVDDGHGSLVPSYGFGYTAVPTRTDSGLPKFSD